MRESTTRPAPLTDAIRVSGEDFELELDIDALTDMLYYGMDVRFEGTKAGAREAAAWIIGRCQEGLAR